MGSLFLKWLAAIGTGAATAGLTYAAGHIGSGPAGVDPWLAGVIAGAMSKIVGWLTGKVPATP